MTQRQAEPVAASDPADRLPAWAYPTAAAKLLHWFPERGEPSLCRAYSARVVALFEFPESTGPTRSQCCATCWRKLGQVAR